MPKSTGVTYGFVFCQTVGWHFIIQVMVCFSSQNTIEDWDFHREIFIVRLSLTAHIHDI